MFGKPHIIGWVDLSTIEVKCTRCNKIQQVTGLTDAQVTQWEEGELIQKAMPQLTAEQRELLISGTCPKCWKELFE